MLWAVSLSAIAQESNMSSTNSEAADTATFVYEGRVVNTTGIPLKDVVIRNLTTNMYATTGVDGKFTMKLPLQGDVVTIAKEGMVELETVLIRNFKVVFILGPNDSSWLPYDDYVKQMEGTSKVYYNEGLKYLAGDSSNEPDYRKALACFFRAAGMENPQAIYQMGRMYEEGIGLTQDYEKAIYWYKMASKSQEANTRLGVMYSEGIGVQQDYKTAGDYFTAAIDLGDSIIASKRLEDLYARNLVKKEDHKIYDIPEESAEFPGDVYAWLSRNIKYPLYCLERSIKGRVLVQFVK